MLLLNFPKPDTSKITIERVFKQVEFEKNIDFIKRIRKISNNTIRLAIDIAEQTAPLKFDTNDLVRSLMRTNIDDKTINKIKSNNRELFRTEIINVRRQDKNTFIIKTRKVKKR